MINVRDLRKNFGQIAALKGISLQIDRGEFFGLLGPNGAGKSTTIKILATLMRPDAGEATVNGYSVIQQPTEVRRSIGLVFQENSLDERITVWENLYFHARVYGVPTREMKMRMEEALALIGLSERRDDRVRTLSGGMKRRLEIARGILHRPAVLILDEPTVGLDPHARNEIWQYIEHLRAEYHVTVLLTTHYMDEAEPCDRVAILSDGQLVANDRPSLLKQKLGEEIVEIRQPTLNDVYLKLTKES